MDVQAFRSELAAECGRVSQFYNAGRDSGITCYDLGHGVDIHCLERRLNRHKRSAGPLCWLKKERGLSGQLRIVSDRPSCSRGGEALADPRHLASSA